MISSVPRIGRHLRCDHSEALAGDGDRLETRRQYRYRDRSIINHRLAGTYTGNQQKVFRAIFGKQMTCPFLALVFGKQMTCPFLALVL
jgi:hypothetical protein